MLLETNDFVLGLKQLHITAQGKPDMITGCAFTKDFETSSQEWMTFKVCKYTLVRLTKLEFVAVNIIH